MQEPSFIFQIIILSTIVILLIGFAAIMLFRLSLTQKKKHLEEKQAAELLYLNEINQAKIDIKDDTLKHVANELHDNIGQLMALVRIHIKTLQKKYADESQLVDINEITSQALNEIRRLSNTLNDEWIKEFGLLQALESQRHFIEKSDNIKLHLNINGNEQYIKKDHALILYRICQEFISNTLKYANANEILIDITYEEKWMSINVKDNGKGFLIENIQKGNGLINMQTRAKMLHTQIHLDSIPGQGTYLKLQYPYLHETV